MKTYKLFWSPEGRQIATVRAKNESSAKRKAPMPYRKYLGEIYAIETVMVRLTHGVKHPEYPLNKLQYSAGSVVPAIRATNQFNYMEQGKLFIATPELDGDGCGILIASEDYKLV